MRLLIALALCLLLPSAGSAGNTATNFGGIGIDGLPDGSGIRVRQLVAGGPAHQAGVKVGDLVTHIDGKATAGGDFEALVQKRLRGVAGTAVVIKVQRPGQEKPLVFTLVRRQMQIKR